MGTDIVWRETNLFGVYMSPLVAYMFAAGLVYLPVWSLMRRLRVSRWMWNASLAGAGIYVCILGALVAWL